MRERNDCPRRAQFRVLVVVLFVLAMGAAGAVGGHELDEIADEQVQRDQGVEENAVFQVLLAEFFAGNGNEHAVLHVVLNDQPEVSDNYRQPGASDSGLLRRSAGENLPNTMTIRLRKPTNEGVSVASWESVDVRCLAWIAKMCLYLSPPARGSTVAAFWAAAPLTARAVEEMGVSGAEEDVLPVEAGVASSDAGFESGVAVSTVVAEFPATVDVTVSLSSVV